MPLNWAAYMTAGMALVEGASKLAKLLGNLSSDTTQEPSRPSVVVKELAARVAALEKSAQEQAAIVQALAVQLNELSAASQTLSRRLLIAYALLIACVVALIGLAWVVLH